MWASAVAELLTKLAQGHMWLNYAWWLLAKCESAFADFYVTSEIDRVSGYTLNLNNSLRPDSLLSCPTGKSSFPKYAKKLNHG